MINVMLWIVFLYPLIGLCFFWPLACFLDKEMPGLKDTVKLTFLWPVALFVIFIFWWDDIEEKSRRRRR